MKQTTNGYSWLCGELEGLKKLGAKIFSIGTTSQKRKIWAIQIGFGDSTVMIQYGIHAREHVTCSLAILHAKQLLQEKCNLKFVLLPMTNPDGTELALFGAQTAKGKASSLLKMNNGNFDFSLWKANACGVDLNNNFDAAWGIHQFASVPGPHGYPGKKPESEKETKAIVRLCKKIKPAFSISFHTKGEEIYYDFFAKKEIEKRDREIADLFAKSFSFQVKQTQDFSSGGFKDWCVLNLKIPSLTIEVGNDDLKHPIDDSMAKEIFNQTKNIGKLCKIAIQKTKEHEHGKQ